MSAERQPVDEAVDEVRQWRARMYEEAGGTIEALADLMRASGKHSPEADDDASKQQSHKRSA